LGYTGMVSASLFALGSTLLTFMTFKIKTKATFRWKTSVMVILILASNVQFWLAKIYFIVVAASWKVGFARENVRMDAAWCIYGPLTAMLALGVLNWFWSLIMTCTGRSQERVDLCQLIQGLIVAAGFIALSVYNAIATVKLGNVVGDPYGKYALNEATGIADAVLLASVPVLQLAMIILSKHLGRYEEGTQQYVEGNTVITVKFS
jgi:hypothetical protein